MYVGSCFAFAPGRTFDAGGECGIVFRYLQILLGRTRHPAADRCRTPSSKGSRTPNPGETNRAGPQKSGDSAEPGFLGQSEKAVGLDDLNGLNARIGHGRSITRPTFIFVDAVCSKGSIPDSRLLFRCRFAGRFRHLERFACSRQYK